MFSKAQNLEKVISIAKKYFVDGHRNNQLFREYLQNHPEHQAKIRYKLFPQYTDSKFVDYNANRIDGSSFIPAEGPRQLNFHLFLQHTVDNHPSIRRVLALGYFLGSNDNQQPQDFYDYCVTPRTNSEYGKYVVDVKRLKGESQVSQGKVYPSNVIESEIYVREKNSTKITKLEVSLLNLYDNDSINLQNSEHESPEGSYAWLGDSFSKICDERKELLWKIFLASQQGPVLVHCRAGLGRTGHVIFTLELLKHYENLFKSNLSSEKIVENIFEILAKLRRYRPALVFTEIQFCDAIVNAEILYQYGLEKNYIKTQDKKSVEETFKL